MNFTPISTWKNQSLGQHQTWGCGEGLWAQCEEESRLELLFLPPHWGGTQTLCVSDLQGSRQLRPRDPCNPSSPRFLGHPKIKYHRVTEVYKPTCRFGSFVWHLCKNIISHCCPVFIMSIYSDHALTITFYTQCHLPYTLEHMCFSKLAFKNSWFSKRYHRRTAALGSEVFFILFCFVFYHGLEQNKCLSP